MISPVGDMVCCLVIPSAQSSEPMIDDTYEDGSGSARWVFTSPVRRSVARVMPVTVDADL